jgi:hypothetical protein
MTNKPHFTNDSKAEQRRLIILLVASSLLALFGLVVNLTLVVYVAGMGQGLAGAQLIRLDYLAYLERQQWAVERELFELNVLIDSMDAHGYQHGTLYRNGGQYVN